MNINIKLLHHALEQLNLSKEAALLIRSLIEESGDKAIINLSDFLDKLPMEILAQLNALITPDAGKEKTLHGRMQDADSFKMQMPDIKTGIDDEAINTVSGGSKITMTGALENSFLNFLSLFQSNFFNPENSFFSSPNRSQLLFNKFFNNQPDDLFQIEFREITAFGNNKLNPDLGTTATAFITISNYQYGDGISTPNDFDRPNARTISNEIFVQTGDIFNPYGASNFLWVWGQFLDHDINLTREAHNETFHINVPTGDAFFDPYFTGTKTISLSRSDFFEGSGTDSSNPRLQINDITAFVDASNIYGSTPELLEMIRGDGGTLKISAGGLLPLTTGNRGIEFLSGDVRTNENVALTSMHTLFAREHNYWVTWLKNQRPDYNDDQLFNIAKAIVEAEIQHITYNEFLPTLLGNNALPTYNGYNPNINPQIATEFATAAFRVGHTMLSSNINRLQENGDESEFGNLTLQNAFFRPDIIMTEGGIDEIMRGLGATYSQTIDNHIIDDVRNFLFGPPGAGGFDLVSLNIQRGRDHGIPDLNTVREAYGLEPYDSFTDLTSDPVLIAKLISLYGDIDRLDLWVGGLLENPHEQAMIGETFFTIITDQFTRLRDGDRFWFETRFDEDFLDIIQSTSLSDIILRNTDIDFLQNDIFTAQNRIGGDGNSNIIIGTDHADLLIGFEGDDNINGGAGQDTLYGGEGNDIFVFDTLDGHTDIIRDFNPLEDKIDIRALLDQFDPLTDAINDFINLTKQSDNLNISFDRDGQGNIFSFENFVTLENIISPNSVEFITN